MKNIDIASYNPIPNGFFRAGQAEAISTMVENFESGIKEQTLDAPTASGKTLSCVAFGNILVNEFGIEKVLFTSPQVALIETGNLFGLPKLVGKSNYPCLKIKEYTADDCIFTGKKEPLWECCGRCPYRTAKAIFNGVKFGATTFARFMADPNIQRETAFLLVDESTNLFDAVIEESSLDVPEDVFESSKTKGVYGALNDYWIVLQEQERVAIIYLEGLRVQVNEYLRDDIEPPESILNESKSALRTYNRISRLASAAHQAMVYIREGIPYVLTTEEEERWNKKVRKKIKTKFHKFRLLDATQPYAKLAERLEGLILASGTPTTKLLTTDPAHKYVKVQHPIEAARRSVTYRPVGKMTMDERFSTAKPMARVIAELHNTYNRNTLVHCGNYQIAGLLLEHLSSIDHIILQDRNHRKEDLMFWMEQDDTIFLSVNYEEGIDLKGEKFPLNIIAKIPFPYLGDPWVKARNDLDGWQWYNMTSAIGCLQACGRTTRDLKDYSETYILDASWGGFYNRCRSLFPDWFVAAYRT